MKNRTLTVSFAEPRQIDLQQQQQQQAMPEPVKVRCCSERLAFPTCELLCCHPASGFTRLLRGISVWQRFRNGSACLTPARHSLLAADRDAER